MRVLLTGITGFVGQSLMPQLARECRDVEMLTLNVNVEEAAALYPGTLYPHCIHAHCDDLQAVVQFNPEIVIHLATVTTSRNDTGIIKPMLKANIEFGVFLLDALSQCRAMKLFVNTGSFAEYRSGLDKFDNAYLYSASKTAFRAFVDYYSGLCGYKYITAVPYSVYGGHMTVKRLMDYIREAVDSPAPIDMTGGEQLLDFIHVDDVAGFFTYVVVNYERFCNLKKNGEEFHLGWGKGISIRELVSMFERKYNKHCNINWGGLPYRERDIMCAIAPVEKNDPVSGWRPLIPIMEGI